MWRFDLNVNLVTQRKGTNGNYYQAAKQVRRKTLRGPKAHTARHAPYKASIVECAGRKNGPTKTQVLIATLVIHLSREASVASIVRWDVSPCDFESVGAFVIGAALSSETHPLGAVPELALAWLPLHFFFALKSRDICGISRAPTAAAPQKNMTESHTTQVKMKRNQIGWK